MIRVKKTASKKTEKATATKKISSEAKSLKTVAKTVSKTSKAVQNKKPLKTDKPQKENKTPKAAKATTESSSVLRKGVKKISVKSPTVKAALCAVKVGQDKKADDFLLIDVIGLSSITDYFLVMSATNERQIKAIAFEISKTLKEYFGFRPIRVDGLTENRWVVMDYGDLIIHIFHDKVRPIYQLEELWADGKKIEVV